MLAFAVGYRREMAESAVERRGVSIALAGRTFGISETCYRWAVRDNDESRKRHAWPSARQTGSPVVPPPG